MLMARRIDNDIEGQRNSGDEGKLALAVLQEQSDLVAEMIVTRTVDNFLTYIAHLMKLLFVQKPEILQDTGQVKLSDILKFADRGSIVQYAIDDYVRKMSYQSLNELCRDLKRKTSFNLFANEAVLKTAVEAVAIRNVLVHNNGLVDTRLAGLLRRYRGHEGHRVGDFDAVSVRNQLILAVVDMDRRALAKWNLPKGTTEVPHLCHSFDQALFGGDRFAETATEADLKPTRGYLTCERCYSALHQCASCAGSGHANIFLDCTECAGTGWICAADGKYWKR